MKKRSTKSDPKVEREPEATAPRTEICGGCGRLIAARDDKPGAHNAPSGKPCAGVA